MSALGQKRSFTDVRRMSALPAVDIVQPDRDVRRSGRLLGLGPVYSFFSVCDRFFLPWTHALQPHTSQATAGHGSST
jgi:hypothetical protein